MKNKIEIFITRHSALIMFFVAYIFIYNGWLIMWTIEYKENMFDLLLNRILVEWLTIVLVLVAVRIDRKNNKNEVK
jgi:cbb3-type cytochrome oxidase subunit 3